MKTKLITLLLSITITLSFSQTDFKWEKTDSVGKSKTQIYSDTKLFISEFWNSSQDVIQNDDKEGGVIVVKGVTKIFIKYGLSGYLYYYGYTVKFLSKDNKYKIILDNVQCKGAEYSSQYTPKCIPPFEDDNYPKIPNDINNLTKKKQKELMVKLKIDFQNIVDSYNSSIKKTSTNEGW